MPHLRVAATVRAASAPARAASAPALFVVFFLAFVLPLVPETAAAQSEARIAVGAPSSGRVAFLHGLGLRIRSLIGPGSGSGALAVLAAAAAAYGVLHALGPGHQKTLIAGYVLGQGGGARTLLGAASVAAASHAASVIVLFGGLTVVGGGLSATVGERAGAIVTRLSALILVIIATRTLFIRLRSARRRFRDAGAAGLEGTVGPGAGPVGTRGSSGEEADECHCGHPAAAGRTAETLDDRRGASPVAALVVGSLTPCPGAAFFLLYGISAGNPGAGILAVLAISAGMWITLVAVGAVAFLARRASLGHAAVRGRPGAALLARSILEIGGSSLMLGFAVALLV